MDAIVLPRIVLTGGPGGGKTTFLTDLREKDPSAERFVLVPEAATLLIRAGHRPGTKEFQLAVVDLQQALERASSLPAKPGQVLVCDRGTVDSLAYWLLLGGEREEFYERTGLDPQTHLNDYFAAIHLQSASIGAVEHYQQLTAGGRVETPEEAAVVDDLCTQVWSAHPRCHRVVNSVSSWQEKSDRIWVLLNQLCLEIQSP